MNPYLILNISKTADQSEIDAAFKSLMEKYSESNYADSPMADLAAKKRKEIEDAYDAIIKMRAEERQAAENQKTDNSYKNASESAFQQNTAAGSNPDYDRIRRYIDSGNTIDAQRVLQSIGRRDAEWFYLSGCVALKNGMYNDAYNFFKTASNKEPQNDEYRAAYMRMDNQAGSYRSYGSDIQQQECCSCCSNLILADCCCECMGGDLIPCC